MSDLRKAAEQALAKLDHLWEIAVDERMNTDVLPEIKALRQALTQPEQEPVAWLYQTAYGDKFIHKKEQAAFHEPNGTFTPLYTAPPKREWVGLEDEDVANVKNEFNRGALWAEQVLKEKNT